MKHLRVPVAALTGLCAVGLAMAFSLTGAASPQSALGPGRLAGPELVLDLGWGSGDDEVGRADRQEGASVGPMSFTVNGLGEIYVLDQENRRVLKYSADGSLERTLALPRPSFQDIAVYDEGLVVLLDRLVSRSVLVLDEAGTPLVEHPIEGKHVPEGGAVTALFAEDDGVWLEVGHSHRVRVLNAWLEPCRRTVRPGRALVPGQHVVETTWDVSGVVQLDVTELDSGRIRASRTVSFDHRIARVLWVEAAPAGYLFAVFHLFEQDRQRPGVTVHDELVVAVYDHDLESVEELRLPHTPSPREQLRQFKVGSDGSLYHLVLSDHGASLRQRRWSW